VARGAGRSARHAVEGRPMTTHGAVEPGGDAWSKAALREGEICCGVLSRGRW
jgi:hypothetical protein